MRFVKAVTALVLSITMLTATAAAANKYINMKLEYDGKTHNYSAEEVHLQVDGKTLTNLPMPPIIFNDYTLVPAREVFEALGAEVNWVSNAYQVYVKYNGNVVMLQIDSKKAYVNGKELNMSIAPKIINDKTMIPLRFASESIGMDVGWDSKARVASVSKPVATTTTKATTTTTTATTVTTTETTTETTTSAVNIAKAGSCANMNGYTTDESYGTASITGLSKASDSDSVFLVTASSAISKVTVTKIATGVVAVDIQNAKNQIVADRYNVNDGRVNSIDISQQTGGTAVTRLLFNMNGDNSFSLYLSSDRKTLGISTGTNTIKSITLDKLIGGDKLTITGTSRPILKTTTSQTGDLLTIDITDAILQGGKGSFDEGKVVAGGSYYQYQTNTVRISLDLKTTAGFTTDLNGNSISLTIASSIATTTAPTTSGGGSVRYDSANGLILPNVASTVAPDSVIHADNYNALNYTLTLNGSLASYISDETISVGDGKISSIDISVGGSQTTISFSESKIMAYNVTAVGSDLYIKPVLPKEKYKKIIILDAGHGGTDVGAGCAGVYEKDITLAMLNKTRALFDASDIKCYATRTTDVYPSFDDRTNLADIGDAFISIHINSAGSNTTASGTETFCQYANNLGNDLTSYIIADRVLKKLLDKLGTVNRGVKSNDLRVLRCSHVPATLIEIGFITNYNDRMMITSEDGQNKTAQAIFEAVTELFNEYTPVR